MLNIFYLATLGVLIIGSYKNTQAIPEHIILSPIHFMILFLGVNLFFRLKKLFPLHSKFLFMNNFLVLPFFTFAVVILAVLDRTIYPNFSFSTTNFHFDALSSAPLFSFLVLLINSPKKWFLKHSGRLTFIFGVLLIIFALHINLWPGDIFAKISQEDNLLEYLQFFALFASSLFSFLICKSLFRKKRRLLSLIFLFSSIGLFLVAGDEISWGQRIFGITTPHKIAQLNAQQEITIHNTQGIDGYVPFGYLILGFYGSFAWTLKFFLRNKNTFFFIPPVHLFPYFFTAFIYNFYTLQGDHFIGVFSEFAELMLYLGIAVFMTINYRKLKK